MSLLQPEEIKVNYFYSREKDSQYVYISDGKVRKIDKPKLKKLKHLKKTDIVSDSIRAKILSGSIKGSFLRAELKKLNK